MGSQDPPHVRSAHASKRPCADGSGPAGVPQTEDKGEDRKEEDEQNHANNDDRRRMNRTTLTMTIARTRSVSRSLIASLHAQSQADHEQKGRKCLLLHETFVSDASFSSV